jgi:recombination protein RecT
MNTVALQQPSRVDVYVAEVLAPERRQRIIEALPDHLPVAKFEEAFRDAVMQTPDILKCDPREVFRSVHNVASTGLTLNPVFGEAWFVVGFSKKDGRHKPQIRIGTRGLVKLARQSGEIASIFAREVHENDVFQVDLYNNETRHEADVFGDRGAVIGYYAKATFKDGTVEFEPMSLRQIEEVRDRYSDGWKAFKAGKARQTPWADSFGEMAKKTVLRRLLKRLPQSTELARALETDRDEPIAEVEQLGPPRGRPRLAAALQQAATPRQEPRPEPELEEEGDGEDEHELDERGATINDGMGYDTLEEKKMDQLPPEVKRTLAEGGGGVA